MLHCQPAQMWRFAATLAALTAVGTPATASAETAVWAAAHLGNLTTLRRGGILGPGAQVGVNVGLTDFFALSFDAASSYHFPNKKDEIPGDRVHSLSAGLRYNFDVFEYVPYGGLAVTGYIDAPLVDASIAQANAGAKLFIGVDWRLHRHWSLGFRGELHSLLTDLGRFPVYTLVGLGLGYHFRF